MADTTIGMLAIVGARLVLLAGVGVLRFPDLYARMHAATKASTVGIAADRRRCARSRSTEAGPRSSSPSHSSSSPRRAPPTSSAVPAHRAPGLDATLDAGDDLGRALDAVVEQQP